MYNIFKKIKSTGTYFIFFLCTPMAFTLQAGPICKKKKIEIEKYTVFGKLILTKKVERHFFNFFWLQLAYEFARICEYLQASCIQHF